MFTLDLARAHIHDLHVAAERSHRNQSARPRTTAARLRRLVARAR